MGTTMHIAVIGGGLMGMSLAYFLVESGLQVTVLEQGESIGGLHAIARLDDDLIFTRYPHTISYNDTHTLELIRKLDFEHHLQPLTAHTGLVHQGKIYPMRSIWDLLMFRPLSLRDRLRLGQTVLQARFTRNWRALDQIPVKEWLIQVGGSPNFERIWAPLLEAKFDNRYADVPATFIWSWLNHALNLRGEGPFKPSLAWLSHGPEVLIQTMAAAIEARGGQIQTGARVREIEIHNQQVGRLRTYMGVLDFDAVIAAVPTPDFSRLLLSADEAYLERLAEVRYLGLICPALVLDRSLSDYWLLRLTDPSSPFASIIEMPCPDNPRYRIVYLPKYTAPDNDWMGVPDETIRDAWLLRLRQIFPLQLNHIKHVEVSRSRYVDPVHSLNAAEHVLAVQTPYRGLYLANASQVYPHLPTSEAVIAHARKVAAWVVREGARLAAAPTAA